MIKRNISLWKVSLLGILTILGLSAAPDNLSWGNLQNLKEETLLSNLEQDPDYQELDSNNIEDAESALLENDPLFSALFDEVMAEIDDDFEDWETSFLDDEIFEDDPLYSENFLEDESPSPSSLLEATGSVISQKENSPQIIELQILPLNELVYKNALDNESWTQQVRVKTTQTHEAQPIIVGNRSLEEVLQEQKQSGLKIYTQRPSLEGGKSEVAEAEASLKGHETLEFGIPKSDADTPEEQQDYHKGPFQTEDFDKSSLAQIFSPIPSTSAREPFRVASDDEMEPFDHASYPVNAIVYDQLTKQEEMKDLGLEAQPAPSLEQPEEEKPTPSQGAEIWTRKPEEEKPAPSQNVEVWTRKPIIEEAPKTQTETNNVEEQKPEPTQGPKETGEEKSQKIVKTTTTETGPEEPPKYLIKFNNAKMSDIIGFVSQVTGKNFVFDPADLGFTVTILSNEPTTIENIISALLQELRIHGLNMVEIGNNIIIHKEVGINAPAEVVKAGEKPPEDAEVITQVYQLKHTDPSTIAAIIRPMLSARAIIEPISNSGHLIVTGLKTNISRITELIESIDTPNAGFEVGEYQAKNIPIARAINIAQELIAPIANGHPVVLTPFSNKNMVYIVTTATLMEQVLDIFKKIDSGHTLPPTRYDRDEKGRPITHEQFMSPEEAKRIRQKQEEEEKLESAEPLGSVQATKFYIHKLQFRPGDQIQQALQAVATSLEGASPQLEKSDLILTINSVQWIKSSNSLIFTGTAQTLAKIKELIDELDTPLPQVLIEILVLETSVDDSLRFGVDWGSRFRDFEAAGSQAFLQDTSILPTVLDTTIPTQSISPANIARTAGFNLGVIGRVITRDNTCDYLSMGAIVRAIHDDARINILLNPRIVVEDSTPAEFFVGINTPFLTQSVANEFGSVITGNFEYKDIGSTLKITPTIGNNGLVTLDIDQEISSVAATNTFTSNATTSQAVTVSANGTLVPVNTTGSTVNLGPTTRKSTTKTRVHMPDGYFLILSGQIRDEKDLTRIQIPCIGGIPWLGAFFSSQDITINKRNLILFIRVQIVDVDRINPITKRQQDAWTEANLIPKEWEYEVDEALNWFNVKDPYCSPEGIKIRE